MEELDGPAESLDAPEVSSRKLWAVVVPDRHSEGSQSSQSGLTYSKHSRGGWNLPSFSSRFSIIISSLLMAELGHFFSKSKYVCMKETLDLVHF